jgi:phosphatidylglycerol:prolipoprotein diacylglycerol transferase
MDPIAFRIGPLEVRWYGIIIMTATFVGGFVASREARRRGENPDHVWNGLLLCVLLGIIGARLYHVFSSPQGFIGWEYYREHPVEIIAFWRGGFAGLGIFGAILGGVLGVFIYTWRRKLGFFHWLDIGAPGLILAQAIGRWGNFVNQELYGYPTDLPWGIYIAPEYRLPGLEKFERFHPCFLYESIWNLAGFLVLMYISRRYEERLLEGDVFCLYLIWYPFGRFFIEALRPDAWLIRGIPAAQIFSVIILLTSIGVMLYRRVRAKSVNDQ